MNAAIIRTSDPKVETTIIATLMICPDCALAARKLHAPPLWEFWPFATFPMLALFACSYRFHVSLSSVGVGAGASNSLRIKAAPTW